MKSQSRWLWVLALGVGAMSCSKADKKAEGVIDTAVAVDAIDSGDAGDAGNVASPAGETAAERAAAAPKTDAGTEVIMLKMISPIRLDQVTHKLYQRIGNCRL